MTATTIERLRGASAEMRVECQVIEGELRRLLIERAELARRERDIEALMWRRFDTLLKEMGTLTKLLEASA